MSVITLYLVFTNLKEDIKYKACVQSLVLAHEIVYGPQVEQVCFHQVFSQHSYTEMLQSVLTQDIFDKLVHMLYFNSLPP